MTPVIGFLIACLLASIIAVGPILVYAYVFDKQIPAWLAEVLPLKLAVLVFVGSLYLLFGVVVRYGVVRAAGGRDEKRADTCVDGVMFYVAKYMRLEKKR